MKISLPRFAYGNLFLRPLAQDDLAATLQWRNHYREWFNDTSEILLANHLNWFKHYQTKDNDFMLIIENAQQDKIGQAAIYNINWEDKSGEFGRFLVNPEFAGKSYMKLACEAMLKLSREQLQISKIHLEVKHNNQKAIHIYQSCGFQIRRTLENTNIMMETC